MIGTSQIDMHKVHSEIHGDVCNRIISLLTDNPAGNEVARAIALDFLFPFNVTKVRISGLRSDDALVFLGDYGFAPSTTGNSEPSEIWRKRDDEIRYVQLNKSGFGFNPEQTCAAVQLKIRGITTGVIAMYFAAALNADQCRELEEIIASLAGPISLFCFVRPNIPSLGVVPGTENKAIDGKLTERQTHILKRIAGGSTNHEIASALGFSVSTIRHETMRIFQILSVSDRQEAARKAQEIGLLANA